MGVRWQCHLGPSAPVDRQSKCAHAGTASLRAGCGGGEMSTVKVADQEAEQSCQAWRQPKRTGSLPCELRLVARPTVAHTGGYVFLKRGPRDPFCTRSGTDSRARGSVSLRFGALIRTQPGRRVPDAHRLFDWQICGFWVFTSGVPVMSEAGFDPEALVLRTGSLPCELRLVARHVAVISPQSTLRALP
jgi:hypothetical protein